MTPQWWFQYGATVFPVLWPTQQLLRVLKSFENAQKAFRSRVLTLAFGNASIGPGHAAIG